METEKLLCSLGIKPLNAELNIICHLLELLGAHHILHVGRIRVKTNQIAKELKKQQFWTNYWNAREAGYNM